MNAEIWILGAASMLLSALLTEWVRRVALARGILDSPNERSSHVRPTPRGGGLAIVASSLAGMIRVAALGYMDARLVYALAGGGASVALVGHLDDRGRVGIAARFMVQVAAAIWAVAWIGWPTTVQLGEGTLHVGAVGAVLSVLGIVWALNLFNFMDGIDGIAASEAFFIAGAGALLAQVAGLGGGIPVAGLVIAAASARVPAVELAAGAHFHGRCRQRLSGIRAGCSRARGDPRARRHAARVADPGRRFHH